jgi:ATP-dependent helicase HrpB
MPPLELKTDLEFPVDHCLPQLFAALCEQSVVILQAPPGAGKTTRIPPALLKYATPPGRSILMLEPRRLAAVNAATFMAGQMDEKVGQTVGYTIRYDRQVSAMTRIEVVTEGVLTRRLQSDPELSGVDIVIFDEFHERNLNSDLALAFCRDAQQGLRPDLKIVIMSATLETEQLSSLLENAPVIKSAGKMYPVETLYLEDDPDPRSLLSVVTTTVMRALQETVGDILVFLPGVYEINRTVEILRKADPASDICPLYGGLSLADQRRAIEPGEKRKVVVSTNVAETSLTIEGVRTVVDSGLENRPRFDAARGLTTLDTVRISQASARQREGRAGRLGPGRCYRLWSAGLHGSLLPQAPPEITQADLTPLALDLACWGVTDSRSLVWVDPPPAGHLAAARALLVYLGALNTQQHLTHVGERMTAIPAHPRLGRLLLQAQTDDCLELGAVLLALLSERLIRGKGAELIESLRRFSAVKTMYPNIVRAHRFWCKRLDCSDRLQTVDESQVARLLAVAYPDRVARLREEGSLHYLLANGVGAQLDAGSPLRGAEFLIVVDLHGRSRSEIKIRSVVRFEREDFEKIFGQNLVWQRQVEWDPVLQKVVAKEVRSHGALIVQTRPVKLNPDDAVAALLDWIGKKGLELLPWRKETQQMRNRLGFLSVHLTGQGWPDFSDAALLESLTEWLGPYLQGVNSVEQLQRIDLKQALLSKLDWTRRQQFDELAPVRIKVPGGSNVQIDYSGVQPVLAVKLQELFGLADSPRIVFGKVPVLIHLLSPAGRPLQVTADLKSFWENVYPEVKKEMKGRYPKHPWPDDPMTAEPTRHTKKKLRDRK